MITGTKNLSSTSLRCLPDLQAKVQYTLLHRADAARMNGHQRMQNIFKIFSAGGVPGEARGRPQPLAGQKPTFCGCRAAGALNENIARRAAGAKVLRAGR